MIFFTRIIAAFLIMFALVAGANNVAAEPMAEQDIALVQKTLSSNVFASGGFIQHRHLNAIPRPLVSSGQFAIWSQQGIYWQTEQPFFSATSYTADDVIDWSEDLQALPSSGSLGTIQKYINEVMVALLNVDNEALARYFASEWSGTPQQWELRLVPSRATVRRSIDNIHIEGEKLIQRIVLESAEGEKTDIQFSDVITAQAVDPNFCPRFFRAPTNPCNTP